MQKAEVAAEGRYYRFYVLTILTITYVFSYMDRQILSILIEDIGAEFTLTDTHKGLLMGLAFALFYAGLGIPVARLADRLSRRNIIAASITVWSLATAACALATGFWGLFAARVGVGIGEAGGGPPSHSMISDYFRKTELTRALSVYSLGTLFGAVIGLSLGGLLADLYGWRMAFVIVGLPGVLIGLLMMLTIKEPPRGRYAENYDPNAPKANFKGAIASLAGNRPYIGALVAHTLAVLVGYVAISWAAAIFVRTFGLSKTEVGVLLAGAILLGGLPGMLAGGWLADKLGVRDVRWMAWVPAIASLIATPFYVSSMMAPSATVMAALFGLGTFCFNIAFAPGVGIIQRVAKPDERALASAVMFFFSNLFGLGLGPTMAGAISDMLKPEYGALSLNYAVAIIALLMIPSALVFFWTAGALKQSEPAPAAAPSH